MKNYYPPKNIIGSITTNKEAVKYDIGEASLAIESIGDVQLLNVWANTFHYEKHNEQEVLIQDIGFEILLPIDWNYGRKESITINFPNNIELIENGWEEIYYGHYYHFEHLKVTNWKIKITPIYDSFKVETFAVVTDDINQVDDKKSFQSNFIAKLDSKIDSKYNWKYSKGNPDAINYTNEKSRKDNK